MHFDTYLAEYLYAMFSVNRGELEEMAKRLEKLREENKTLFTCGNGGSAADSIHLADDFLTACRIKAISLTSNISSVTALANDLSYNDIFTEQLERLSSLGDCLLAISCSGSSQNVLNAAQWARENEIDVIAFTGHGSNKLACLSHFPVYPNMVNGNTGIIQSVYTFWGHYLIERLKIT